MSAAKVTTLSRVGRPINARERKRILYAVGQLTYGLLVLKNAKEKDVWGLAKIRDSLMFRLKTSGFKPKLSEVHDVGDVILDHLGVEVVWKPKTAAKKR